MVVAGIKPHGFCELIARGFVFTNLKEGIGQILMHGRPVRRNIDGGPKGGDGPLVILQAQRSVGRFERRLGRVRRLGDGECSDQAEEENSYHWLTLMGIN